VKKFVLMYNIATWWLKAARTMNITDLLPELVCSILMFLLKTHDVIRFATCSKSMFKILKHLNFCRATFFMRSNDEGPITRIPFISGGQNMTYRWFGLTQFKENILIDRDAALITLADTLFEVFFSSSEDEDAGQTGFFCELFIGNGNGMDRLLGDGTYKTKLFDTKRVPNTLRNIRSIVGGRRLRRWHDGELLLSIELPILEPRSCHAEPFTVTSRLLMKLDFSMNVRRKRSMEFLELRNLTMRQMNFKFIKNMRDSTT